MNRNLSVGVYACAGKSFKNRSFFFKAHIPGLEPAEEIILKDGFVLLA